LGNNKINMQISTDNSLIGTGLGGFLINVTGYFRFVGAVIRNLFRLPFYFGEILNQLFQIGYKSLSIVSLTAIFAGMVLSLQTGTELARFGAKSYIGSVLALSLVRELGPVLTSLVVAGRVGSGITAELGSMKVTDQIDALRAMATNPIKKLVLTRIIALLIMLPILVAVSDMLGLLGGLFIAMTNLNIGYGLFKSTVLTSLYMEDLISGFAKPVVFAFIIGSIGCYLGINTKGGTRGVGNATTHSVVISSIAIFLTDFILTKIFFMVGRPL
jgi:phospholipid/cholesterol/gamma-HCH transport system permease protein